MKDWADKSWLKQPQIQQDSMIVTVMGGLAGVGCIVVIASMMLML